MRGPGAGRGVAAAARAAALAAVLGLAACRGSGPPAPDAAAPDPGRRAEAAEPAGPARPADWVLRGGLVYTADARGTRARALAVRDGEIVAVGSEARVAPWLGPRTPVVELAGRTLRGCGLQQEDTLEKLLAALERCARRRPEGWLLGLDFDLGVFPDGSPRREVLDAILPDRPVLVLAMDGHNAWANSEALSRAGIDRETPDPPKGVIERDPATGEPSGTLRETAQSLVADLVPKPSPAEDVRALRRALRELSRLGVTSLIDASTGETDWRAYRWLAERGELTARVRACLTHGVFADHRGPDFERALAARASFASPRLRIDAVKLFLDGVLEGETAALLEPYLDVGESRDGQNRGELNFEPEELERLVTRFDALGLQVHMHAIGDAGVRAGLDAVEAARARNGPRDNRHHIAHLQLVAASDLPRFAALDVTANFQSLWAYPDTWILELNLPVVGRERVNRMYPLGSLRAAGARIVGGSDWSVSSASPLLAIETAVRRQDPDDPQALEILNPGERVDLAFMLDAYTRNAAWLMHQEQQVGSLELGKRADLVVLSRDLFAIPADEIGEVEVLLTLLDGEAVHAHPALR
jgi:predicted amidohydrolase YtcJ